MAHQLGRSDRSLRRYRAELETLGYLTVYRTPPQRGPDGRWHRRRSNTYYLHIAPAAGRDQDAPRRQQRTPFSVLPQRRAGQYTTGAPAHPPTPTGDGVRPPTGQQTTAQHPSGVRQPAPRPPRPSPPGRDRPNSPQPKPNAPPPTVTSPKSEPFSAPQLPTEPPPPSDSGPAAACGSRRRGRLCGNPAGWRWLPPVALRLRSASRRCHERPAKAAVEGAVGAGGPTRPVEHPPRPRIPASPGPRRRLTLGAPPQPPTIPPPEREDAANATNPGHRAGPLEPAGGSQRTGQQ